MKHIFRSFNFETLEYKEAENLLNHMAERGYEFKRTGKGFIRNIAVFEKNERAKKLKYAIDVAKRKDWEKSEYYQFYKDSGWEKVDCFNKRIYIFVSPKDNVEPLYTDESSEKIMLREASVNNGELLNHFLQLLCLSIVLKVMFFIKSREEDFHYAFYGIILLLCLTTLYYVSQVAAKLLYWGTGWKLNSHDMGKKMMQFMRGLYTLFWSIFFILLPLSSSYIIWKRTFLPGSSGEISLEFVQILAFVGSAPVILLTTYLQTLHPEKGEFKVLNFVGAFMFYWGLMGFSSYTL